jgi:hypothetical protein
MEGKLLEELKRVEEKLGLSLRLKVVWVPDPSKPFSGELKDGTIYIYDEDVEAAVRILKHEVIDYLLTSRIVKPLIDLVNLLIKSKEYEVYKEKERVVDMLSRLV